MKRVLVAGVLVIAMLGLLSAAAFTAPNDIPGNVNVSATAEKSVWLSVTDATVALSGAPEGFVSPAQDDTAAFSVKSNWDWSLSMGVLPDLTGPGSLTLPASRIEVNGLAADAAQVVASGAKTGSTPLAVPVTYSLAFNWDDVPATYTATHVYTLSYQ